MKKSIRQAPKLLQARRKRDQICGRGTQPDITNPKRAWTALQQSEAEFRAIFDYVRVGIVLLSPEGRQLRSNKACQEILGYELEELKTFTFTEVTHPEDLPRELNLYEELMAGQRDWYQIDKRILRKNGSIAWVNWVVSLIRDDQGHPLNALAVLHDISGRREAEEAQIRNQQEMSVLNQIVAAVTSTLDLKQILDNVLGNLLRLSKTARASVRLFDREDDCLKVAACLGQGGPVSENLQRQAGEGAAGWVLQNGKPLAISEVKTDARFLSEKGTMGYLGLPLFSQGRVIGVVSLISEVGREFSAEEIDFLQEVCGAAAISIENALVHSEIRQRAEKLAGEMALQKQYAENILHSIADGVYTADVNNRIMSWNPGAEAITGWKAEETIGHPCTDLLCTSDKDAERICLTPRCPLEHIRLTRSPALPVEIAMQFPKGKRMISISAAPLLDEKQEITGAVIVFRDVSRERELLESSRRATQSKSLFLANMSHEIRTPLNAILGFSQLMFKDPALTPNQAHQLNNINRSGEHLLAVINDVLEMSKIEAGHAVLNRSVFDLRPLVQDLTKMFQVRTEAKGLLFQVELADTLPQTVLTDENKLRQIFINLLSNAIKFTKQGQVVWRLGTRTSEQGGLRLVAEVEDTGPGIPTADIDRIFEAFEQNETGIKLGGGTGLGLAISRRFAQMMAGDITVTSEPGRRSCFRLEIGIEKGEAGRSTSQRPARSVIGIIPGTGLFRVLVADSQTENCNILVEMLQRVGFETQAVSNGHDAISVFETWSPQAILMDMRMPGLSGFETTQRIKATEKGQATPIMAITTRIFNLDRKQALAAGADDFLVKPFCESELFAKLGHWLQIKYIYANQPAKETTDALEERLSKPIKEILAAMPVELTRELRDATIKADYDLILRLIERFAAYDPVAAQLLRKITEYFDYQQLLDWLPVGEA